MLHWCVRFSTRWWRAAVKLAPSPLPTKRRLCLHFSVIVWYFPLVVGRDFTRCFCCFQKNQNRNKLGEKLKGRSVEIGDGLGSGAWCESSWLLWGNEVCGQTAAHGAMLPSTAPSGADPDNHHHSCLHLLTQWHLHHRGPCRPHQDLHLWVFKGRSSGTCSAQIGCRQPVCTQVLEGKQIWEDQGRGSGGRGSTVPSLAEAQGHIILKNKRHVFSQAFFSFINLRWQTMGATTKTAWPFPALRPCPLRAPAAPRWPPLPLTSQRSARRSHLFYISCCFSFIGSVSYIVSSVHQVVKSGSSETRVEKRIVITADSDVDPEKVQTLPPYTYKN